MFEVIHRPRLQEAANLRLLAEKDPNLNGEERVQLAKESNAIVEAVCLEQQYAAVDALVLASLAHVYSAIGKMQESGFRLAPSQEAGTAAGVIPPTRVEATAASNAPTPAAAAPVPGAGQVDAGDGAAAAPPTRDISYINPLDELPQSLHRLLTPRHQRLLRPWWYALDHLIIILPAFLIDVVFLLARSVNSSSR